MIREERGTSFTSDLLALAIIGVALTVLITGLSTTGSGVLVVKQQVSAQNYARQQMEAIKDAEYQADPTAVPYPTVSPIEAYSVSVEVSSIEDGLQLITVEVYSAQELDQPLLVLEDYKGNRS